MCLYKPKSCITTNCIVVRILVLELGSEFFRTEMSVTSATSFRAKKKTKNPPKGSLLQK